MLLEIYWMAHIVISGIMLSFAHENDFRIFCLVLVVMGLNGLGRSTINNKLDRIESKIECNKTIMDNG